MSYDPTEWAPQAPGQPQPPAQPPVTPPAYGQAPQPPAPPAYGQPPQPQYPSVPPTAYGQPPQAPPPPAPYGQPSSPSQPPYGQPQPTAPVYGQPSSPSLPPYGAPTAPSFEQSSNPSLPPYGAPADPYAPPPPNWGAPMPPGYVPPVVPQKKSGAKLWVILLVIVVVLAGAGGGGFAYYQATRPKPAITMTSQYLDGATPVGAASTSLTLQGTDFTANSTITVLLDGTALTVSPPVQSDSKGAVNATLKVTSDWAVGNHTITAKDAAGYVTKLGVKIEIVTPGQSKTPGPNGAPTDSASGTIIDTVTVDGKAESPETLKVTGTPTGGTVCGMQDDGKKHSYTGTAGGLNYTGSLVLACSGTYKGGQLDYTETATSYTLAFSNGVTCKATQPVIIEHLVGTFSSANAVSGTFTSDSYTLACNLGVPDQTISGQQGTFVGIASMQ